MILLRTVDPIDITFASDLNLNRCEKYKDRGSQISPGLKTTFRHFVGLPPPGTRNRVCHFNFGKSRNVKHEETNLRWLISALGEKTVEIVEPSA